MPIPDQSPKINNSNLEFFLYIRESQGTYYIERREVQSDGVPGNIVDILFQHHSLIMISNQFVKLTRQIDEDIFVIIEGRHQANQLMSLKYRAKELYI